MGQVFRKAERLATTAGLSHQADGLPRDSPAAPGVAGITGDLAGRQDHVQRVQAQAREQIVQAARLQGELHIVAPKQGGNEALLKVARQRGHRANAQHLPLPDPAIAQQRSQLLAGRKDGVGITQRQPPGFGELQ